MPNTFEPKDYDEFKEIVEIGFARAWWCGNEACEDKVKEETQATIRCIPMEQSDRDGDVYCLWRGSGRDYNFRAGVLAEPKLPPKI